MTEREHDPEHEHEHDEEAEPAVRGGTGPGVSPGDVETPGAATTPNEEGDDSED